MARWLQRTKAAFYTTLDAPVTVAVQLDNI